MIRVDGGVEVGMRRLLMVTFLLGATQLYAQFLGFTWGESSKEILKRLDEANPNAYTNVETYSEDAYFVLTEGPKINDMYSDAAFLFLTKSQKLAAGTIIVGGRSNTNVSYIVAYGNYLGIRNNLAKRFGSLSESEYDNVVLSTIDTGGGTHIELCITRDKSDPLRDWYIYIRYSSDVMNREWREANPFNGKWKWP